MGGMKQGYALRLPASLKAEAEKVAREDGTTLNQLINTALAEKLSALRTESYFRERRVRADMAVFDRIMARSGGEPPRPGDEFPTSAKRPRVSGRKRKPRA